jgi:hypothetical protein
MPKTPTTTRSQRPKALTVFAAAFVAGAVAAVGINRALDVHLAQAKPQVECEPIFVALRDLAQGSPVTIWDVALRDWPKAMLPTTALRADDRFEGMLVKHPVREGQPLLSVQLVAAEARTMPAETVEQVVETYAPRTFAPAPAAQPDADLWAAADQPAPQTAAAAEVAAEAVAAPAEAVIPEPTITTPTIDEVVTTADIPPLMASVEPAPAESVDESAATVTAQPELPAEPTEPVEPTQPTQQVVAAPVQPEATATPAEAAVTQTEATPEQAEAAPAQPEATSAQPVAAAPKRYLVVPERIAVQAEASFTSPAPQPPVETVPAQPAPTQVVEQQQVAPSATTRSETRQTASTTQPAATKPRPQTTAKRPTAPAATARSKSKSVPRVAQAPTLETHPNTEPQQPPSAFDGLFPNLRATFGAVDEEMQKIRAERAAQDRAAQARRQAATPSGQQRPQQPPRPQEAKQPSRAARWPWSFGR